MNTFETLTSKFLYESILIKIDQMLDEKNNVTRVKSIYNKITNAIHSEEEINFLSYFKKLIDKVESTDNKCAIIIAPNSKELYDMFYVNDYEVGRIYEGNISTSESIMQCFVNTNNFGGYVIPDIDGKSIRNFLISYFVWKSKNKNRDNKRLHTYDLKLLEYIYEEDFTYSIIYSLLPKDNFDLYSENIIAFCDELGRQNNYPGFEEIYKMVENDRFIGTKLKRLEL